ncbi:hypothetical protein NM688_g5608 [Phlebia brevispora]|uniref:Uncharacterized protein n=1 Tax=Phlebia brevispora TaxID=194682 RepID=A0ACC1SSL1_9APHY|nr:hypothetical protein NM688_g5608 [Phlebia brevispora]
MLLEEILTFKALATVVIAWVVWTLARGIYNIYWHPLSKYPGPTVAAFNIWWKFYHDVVADENLVDTLRVLHSKYGDVVRIAPNELHFSKPSAFHEIHNSKNRWTKEPLLYHAFAEAESSFSLCDYRRAKARKDILLPFFSRKAITDMQHLVQSCLTQVNEMCSALKVQHREGKSTDIMLAFRCTSLDTITSFCFANSLHALKAPDFQSPSEQAMTLSLPNLPRIKYFPFIKVLSGWVPPVLISYLKPELAGLVRLRHFLEAQIRHVLKDPEALEQAPHPVIYHSLLNPAHGKRPSFLSLRDEALLLLFAGTDTASNTLAVGTIHALSNPSIHAKLKAEILEAWPDPGVKPRYEALERLPYLSAVIKESLRLANGVLSPMTRVVPAGGAEISGKWIPGGTIVGIGSSFVHLDDTIFANPYTFEPERWLGPEASSLEHWLVSFSRGPRSCLGINLANCEMFLVLASLFRYFDLQLDGVRSVIMITTMNRGSWLTHDFDFDRFMISCLSISTVYYHLCKTDVSWEKVYMGRVYIGTSILVWEWALLTRALGHELSAPAKAQMFDRATASGQVLFNSVVLPERTYGELRRVSCQMTGPLLPLTSPEGVALVCSHWDSNRPVPRHSLAHHDPFTNCSADLAKRAGRSVSVLALHPSLLLIFGLLTGSSFFTPHTSAFTTLIMNTSLSPRFMGLLGLLTLVPSVAAHGYLSQVVIDGQAYKGNVPNNYAFDSPIRLIDDSAAKGTLVAAANPGSNVTFAWVSGEGTNWPHYMGPLMTYMAPCTGTTCDQFDASQAQWFKIDQAGQKPGSSDYFQHDFYEGQTYSLTLPQNIAPGDYLVRHEVCCLVRNLFVLS